MQRKRYAARTAPFVSRFWRPGPPGVQRKRGLTGQMWLGRRSSWAIGHSATMAGGPIGTLPCGPTTWVNIDVGMTSTSSSHAVVLDGERVDLDSHRVEEPRRQAPPDTGHEPHLGCRTPRPRAAIVDEPMGTTARPSRRRAPRRGPRRPGGLPPRPTPASTGFDLDVVALESPHERRRRVAGIECEHADVTSPDQAVADHVRIADRDDDRFIR